MNKERKTIFFACSILFLLISMGCSNQREIQSLINVESDNSSDAELEDEPKIVDTETIETPEEFIDNSTPTPDLRTPPEQWQDWPIIPTITNNAISIYKKGISQDVNKKSFSKIGDCQNIKEAFLGIYDHNGRYFLRNDELGWQETIDNFNGFFNRDGEAIEQGLNVAAVLSPLHADPDICLPSESPLDCELRTANPSFAFISFERWWPNETPPDVYEKYLRIVVQKTIDQGTIPILVTKADNIEGNHQINQIIANLAFENDIPLYNWWKAAQLLPHRGMDPERNDGFHISTESWDTRSYYALETLDFLWKGLKDY
jgi:hypothetical protein